ncbi:hypothetical protein [Myxosarcina sp. GI1(2024)]
MNEDALQQERSAEKVEISIQLDSEILEQIQHLTNDPSRAIEAALKHWLRGERDPNTDLTRTWQRNPPLPPRGEWND